MDYVIVTSHRPRRPLLTPNTAEQELLQAMRSGQSLDRLCQLLARVSDINGRGDGFWTPLTLASYLGLHDLVAKLLHWEHGAGTFAARTEDSVPSCCDLGEGLGAGEETAGDGSSCTCGAKDVMTCSTLSAAELSEAPCSPLPGSMDCDSRDLCAERDARVVLANATNAPVRHYQGHGTVCSSPVKVGSAQSKTSSGRVCLIDECNEPGDTALICGIRSDSLSVCALLLEHGANVNLPSQNGGFSPLHVAVENCSHDMVNLLLEHNADVQATDNVGITPLYMAIKTHSVDMVRTMIEAGSDVNIGSQDHAPIFLAARLGLLDICQALCEAGCEVNVRNKYGVSPVYEAALKGHLAVLSYLLEQGGSVNEVDMYNCTPLHVAAMNGNVGAIQLLVAAGANLKMRNQQGLCPVHLAIQQGKAEALHTFLQLGVDIIHPAPSSFPLVWWQSLSNKVECRVGREIIVGCSTLPLPSILQLSSFIRCHPSALPLMLLSGLQGAAGVVRQLVEQMPESLQPEVLHFVSGFFSQPLSLKELSRIAARQCLGNKIFHHAPLLPIPVALQSYLMMDDC